MKGIIIFCIGVLIGGIVALVIVRLNTRNEYVEIQSDYVLENGGVLKKGTIIKIDKPFSEGFTRYVLYLNLRDGDLLNRYHSERPDEILPYWIQSDTTVVD